MSDLRDYGSWLSYPGLTWPLGDQTALLDTPLPSEAKTCTVNVHVFGTDRSQRCMCGQATRQR